MHTPETAYTPDTKIPVTTVEFNDLCQSIFTEHGYPDKPGYRHMIASLILHMPDTVTLCSKAQMADAIKKAQANEVAYWAIQEAKKAMDEANAKPEETNTEETPAEQAG